MRKPLTQKRVCGGKCGLIPPQSRYCNPSLPWVVYPELARGVRKPACPMFPRRKYEK